MTAAYELVTIARMNAANKLTTDEAAEILNVNSSRIRQLLIAGQLVGEKFGWAWSIRRREVDRLKRRREVDRLKRRRHSR